MAKFQITQKTSGQIIGTFEADDERGALDAMARDAGYEDFEDSVLGVRDGPDEIWTDAKIVEMEAEDLHIEEVGA